MTISIILMPSSQSGSQHGQMAKATISDCLGYGVTQTQAFIIIF